ncbi:MAG: hypothetical protein Q9167_007973 [Letrouitia subvulpina]
MRHCNNLYAHLENFAIPVGAGSDRENRVIFDKASYLLNVSTTEISESVPRIAAVGQGIQYSEDPPQAKLVGSVRDYKVPSKLHLVD